MSRRALAALAPLLLTACYVAPELRNEPWQRAFYEGDTARCVKLLREQLDAARGEADEDVLRLELASALLADGQPAQAAPLLVQADGQLETLDYSHAPLEQLAGFLFSVTPADYRATRFERVLLNVQALLAFLASGQVEDAAVEARRARILLLQEDLPEDERCASACAWALAGVALRQAGAHGEAEEAFRVASALVPDEASRAAVQALASRAPPGSGSVLVVVQDGKAPVRAQCIVRLWVGGQLRRVQFPALVGRPGGYGRVHVELDGAPAGVVAPLLDVAGQSLARYEQDLPRLLASAVLAALPRAAIQSEVRRQLRDDDPDEDDDAGKTWLRNLLADIAAFFTGELLAECLPADTRCWTLLPASVRAARLDLPPGRHRVDVDLLDGLAGAPARRVSWDVDVAAGELAVVYCVSATEEGYARVQPPGEQDLEGTLVEGRALELLEDAVDE